MQRKLPIMGLDGSLRNFGMALMTLDVDTMEIAVEELILTKTAKEKSKQVRASSDNFNRAADIAASIQSRLTTFRPQAVFVEVPSGGQSYAAVLGFGIVIGLYASILTPRPIEVSPAETKLASVGVKNASKEEVMAWAFAKYPKAPWLTRKLKGEIVPIADNEHLADSVAIAHAGIKTPAFAQALVVYRSMIAA